MNERGTTRATRNDFYNWKFKTYGKQNNIRKTINEIRNRFKINPYSEQILKQHGLKVYMPRISRLRYAVGTFLILLCVITPFTNFLIYYIIKWILK